MRGRVPELYFGGICLITDKNACPLTCVEMARMAMDSGVRWIQYRDKETDRLKLYRTALQIRKCTSQYDACFILNDHPDIAASVDADGVHLGQNDLPLPEARRIMGAKKIIGISTHNLEQALRAEYEGADYIGFGPIYHTGTKDAGSPKGAELLQKIRSRVKIPVVAIGGINAENIGEVMDAGANAIAVASGMLKGMVEENAHKLLSRIKCSPAKNLSS